MHMRRCDSAPLLLSGWVSIFSFCVGVATYLNASPCAYVFDDTFAIVTNPDVPPFPQAAAASPAAGPVKARRRRRRRILAYVTVDASEGSRAFLERRLRRLHHVDAKRVGG